MTDTHIYNHYDDPICVVDVKIAMTTRGATFEIEVKNAPDKTVLDQKLIEARSVIKGHLADLLEEMED